MSYVEMWGGSDALVMPHICAIPEEERNEFRDGINALLLKTFHDREFRHMDVAWRNICFYVDKKNENCCITYYRSSIYLFIAGATTGRG